MKRMPICNVFSNVHIAEMQLEKTDHRNNECLYTVDSEIFARTLFSRIALKDILVM